MMKSYAENEIQIAVIKAFIQSTHGLQFLLSRASENIIMRVSLFFKVFYFTMLFIFGHPFHGD